MWYFGLMKSNVACLIISDPLCCYNSARRAERRAKRAMSRPQGVSHGARFQGCHFHNSGLPLCAESARRAERAREAGLKLPPGRQLRFRVATSTIQGCHFVQNQPKGLSGPVKRAPNRPQGDSLRTQQFREARTSPGIAGFPASNL